MFGINQGKGFWITFANGWTASVQFGEFNYCANKDLEFDFEDYITQGKKTYFPDHKSPDAEIAAWNAHTWHDFGGDQVKGWCKPDEVLAFLNLVASKEA